MEGYLINYRAKLAKTQKEFSVMRLWALTSFAVEGRVHIVL